MLTASVLLGANAPALTQPVSAINGAIDDQFYMANVPAVFFAELFAGTMRILRQKLSAGDFLK
jgi:hypothetical protein